MRQTLVPGMCQLIGDEIFPIVERARQYHKGKEPHPTCHACGKDLSLWRIEKGSKAERAFLYTRSTGADIPFFLLDDYVYVTENECNKCSARWAGWHGQTYRPPRHLPEFEKTDIMTVYYTALRKHEEETNKKINRAEIEDRRKKKKKADSVLEEVEF